MSVNKTLSQILGMVGRRASPRAASPTALPQVAAADLLDEVADRWSCWRLRSETPRHHRHRLQLHLHTLAIAIEDDLALLDQLDPASVPASQEEIERRAPRSICDVRGTPDARARPPSIRDMSGDQGDHDAD